MGGTRAGKDTSRPAPYPTLPINFFSPEPNMPALTPNPNAFDSPPMYHPAYLLVDLEEDFLVAGADTEAELLPHALAWSQSADYTPGSLVIYERHALVEL